MPHSTVRIIPKSVRDAFASGEGCIEHVCPDKKMVEVYFAPSLVNFYGLEWLAHHMPIEIYEHMKSLDVVLKSVHTHTFYNSTVLVQFYFGGKDDKNN